MLVIIQSALAQTPLLSRTCINEKVLTASAMDTLFLSPTLETAIAGKPKPKFPLLAEAADVNALVQGALQQFTQWPWIEHSTFQWRGRHFTISAPASNIETDEKTLICSFYQY